MDRKKEMTPEEIVEYTKGIQSLLEGPRFPGGFNCAWLEAVIKELLPLAEQLVKIKIKLKDHLAILPEEDTPGVTGQWTYYNKKILTHTEGADSEAIRVSQFIASAPEVFRMVINEN